MYYLLNDTTKRVISRHRTIDAAAERAAKELDAIKQLHGVGALQVYSLGVGGCDDSYRDVRAATEGDRCEFAYQFDAAFEARAASRRSRGRGYRY